MTTSGSTLVQLAKQGNPKAIATLINQHLHTQKINAKATIQEGSLKILLEADKLPQKDALIAFIEKGIRNLNSTVITQINIYGRNNSEKSFAWHQTIDLSPEALCNMNKYEYPSSTQTPKIKNNEDQLKLNSSQLHTSTKVFTKTSSQRRKSNKSFKTSYIIFITIPIAIVAFMTSLHLFFPSEKTTFTRKLNYYLNDSRDPQINERNKTVFRQIFGHEVAYEIGQEYCQARRDGVTEEEIRNHHINNEINLLLDKDVSPEEVATLGSIRISIHLAAQYTICPEFRPLSLEERLIGD